MPTVTVTLPDELKAFLESQAARGGFASEAEYLVSLLRRAADRQADRKRVEALLLEGLDSGLSTPLTKEDFDEIEREGIRLIEDRRRRPERR